MADTRMELKKVEVKRAFDIIFGGEDRPQYLGFNQSTFNELYHWVPFEGDSDLGFSLLGIPITLDERIENDIAHLYYNM